MVGECNHSRYKQGGYLTTDNALKAMRSSKSDICWMGRIITNCEDCGKDISMYHVVEVKTVQQYLGGSVSTVFNKKKSK